MITQNKKLPLLTKEHISYSTQLEHSVPLGCTVITLASVSISFVFVYWLAWALVCGQTPQTKTPETTFLTYMIVTLSSG